MLREYIHSGGIERGIPDNTILGKKLLTGRFALPVRLNTLPVGVQNHPKVYFGPDPYDGLQTLLYSGREFNSIREIKAFAGGRLIESQNWESQKQEEI